MVDVIIVGFGLAGTSLAYQLESNSRSYIVIEDGNMKASSVAGGICNPVMLKRFTLASQVDLHLPVAISYYNNISKFLGVDLWLNQPVFRRFSDIEDQNKWSVASVKTELDSFLSDQIFDSDLFYGLSNSFGYGEVLSTDRIDLKLLMNTYIYYLKGKNMYFNEVFNYNLLHYSDQGVSYNGMKAKYIVFCQGARSISNPYFKYLSFQSKKGEYLVIRAVNLKLKTVVKGVFFIIPLGDDYYKVGATYLNNDLTYKPTKFSRQKIVAFLDDLLQVDYEIIDTLVGMRLVFKDRMPVVQYSRESSSLVLFTALGSRGVVTSPYYAKELFSGMCF